MLVDTHSPCNVILGRPSFSLFAAIISPAHLMMKFLVEDEKERVIGVGLVRGDQQVSRKCQVVAIRSSESHKRSGE